MSSPRKTLLTALTLLLLTATLPAAPDPVRNYKKHLSRVASRQHAFEAKELDQALLDANVTYRAPWKQRGDPEAPKVIDYDFSGYAQVYERYMDFEEEKGDLALALAEVDTDDAAEQLVETLLSILTDIQKQNQTLMNSKPRTRGIHDQTPAIKRYGAWLHHDMVVLALGKIGNPEAVAWLTKEGWEKAEKWDRSQRSVLARVAIVDALGLSGRTEEQAFLSGVADEEEPGLRIAALEALAKLGLSPETKQRLERASAEDPCFAVRDAASAALGASRKEVEPQPRTFFGIPIDSERVIVILDASQSTLKPVDVALLKERTWWEWRAVAEQDRDWVSQVLLMTDETAYLVGALPDDAKLNLVLVNGPKRILPLEPRGMISADARGKRRATAFLKEVVAEGWAPQIEGLWEACRIAGASPWNTDIPDDPGADTFLLVSNGVPSGGQILHGAAIVDDVRRRFRFNRIRIHTVRLDDNAAPAEVIMKGIAEATGGTYVHRKAP